MSITSVLKEYPIHQLGASYGNYLHFDESSHHWSVVQLNCLKRLIRWLGFGYFSTRLEFIAKKLSLTPEANRGAEALNAIQMIWKKAFPTVACPLTPREELNFTAKQHIELIAVVNTTSLIEKAEITPLTSIDESSSSSAQNKAAACIAVGTTSISIEEGGLAESGVTCILFPTVRKSYSFILTSDMEEAFEELSIAVGYNMKEKVKLLYANSTEGEAALPSITDVKNLACKGITRVLLPKFPPDAFSEKDPTAVDRYAQFLTVCLDLAKNEGVRSFAFSPLNFNRSQNSEWTKIDFEVIETYIQANPGAFDAIKLRYKSDTEQSAAHLSQAISVCKTMEHPFGVQSV